MAFREMWADRDCFRVSEFYSPYAGKYPTRIGISYPGFTYAGKPVPEAFARFERAVIRRGMVNWRKLYFVEWDRSGVLWGILDGQVSWFGPGLFVYPLPLEVTSDQGSLLLAYWMLAHRRLSRIRGVARYLNDALIASPFVQEYRTMVRSRVNGLGASRLDTSSARRGELYDWINAEDLRLRKRFNMIPAKGPTRGETRRRVRRETLNLGMPILTAAARQLQPLGDWLLNAQRTQAALTPQPQELVV